MNEKGLTLKKLLTIIFVVALIVFGVYYLMGASKRTKENAFVSDVQNLIKFARDSYAATTLLETEESCFHSETNPVKSGTLLNDKSVKYYIRLSESGQVSKIVVKNDLFEFSAEANSVSESDVGNQKSKRKYKVTEVNENTILPDCN